LVHFVLIGLAVFLIYPGKPVTATNQPQVIQISAPALQQARAQFQASWRRPPTDAEVQGLIDEMVREEVLSREALKLGLDQGDAVIRQRLRLKLEFIGEAAAAALVPEEAELQKWHDANRASFAPAALVTFQQVMVRDAAEGDALRQALEAGADPATLGSETLLPLQISDAPAQAVDLQFGAGFFSAVAALPPGAWAGPVASAYGLHLIRLEKVTAPDAPPLADIRDSVVEGWRRDQAAALREAQYKTFLSRYEVRLPEATK
jgi:parvulin-like peptidyl-prolyl isomerase